MENEGNPVTSNTPSTSQGAGRRARSLARRVKRSLLGGGAAPSPDEVTVRLDRQHGRIAATERDLSRIGTQVAALEVRIEGLRQRLDLPSLDADDEARAEARSIVEEVRREHEQVRARISAAMRYEERLRQLEERVSAL